MNRFKIDKINYYILLSVLIHFLLFLFIEKEKDVTLGEKIIPIEVVDNLLESGIGEALKKSKKITERHSLKKESQKDKTNQEPLDQIKSSKDYQIYKNIKAKTIEADKSKTSNINQTILKENKSSGSINGIKNNKPEKGTLKGKGTIKVRCLKCIQPIYPSIALRRGEEGKAIIKIWINTNGKVTKAELFTKSGIESIDNAALKSAITSTFYPIDENTIIDIEYDMKIR